MKSLSPNTKIDFRKLLATVHGLPNSTNRFGSGAVKTHKDAAVFVCNNGVVEVSLLLSDGETSI